MINGRGGNIGVCAGGDGLLLIDAKFANLAEPLRAVLAGLGEGDPAFLLNTHYHGDHTGGNTVFGAVTPILAHHNVRARLTAGEDPPPEALPVLTFEEGVSLHFNGEEIEVVHFPAAHTDGDAVVFFKGSDVVHMGDIMFHGLFPYVDIDAGGRVDGVIAAVEAVLARDRPRDAGDPRPRGTGLARGSAHLPAHDPGDAGGGAGRDGGGAEPGGAAGGRGGGGVVRLELGLHLRGALDRHPAPQRGRVRGGGRLVPG